MAEESAWVGRKGDVEWNKRLSLSGESKTSNRAQAPSLVVYLTSSTCLTDAADRSALVAGLSLKFGTRS